MNTNLSTNPRSFRNIRHAGDIADLMFALYPETNSVTVFVDVRDNENGFVVATFAYTFERDEVDGAVLSADENAIIEVRRD